MKHLVDVTLATLSALDPMPTCHNLVPCLLKQFFKLRLHAFGKKQKLLMKEEKDSARSSKSMQMRKSVNEIKQ